MCQSEPSQFQQFVQRSMTSGLLYCNSNIGKIYLSLKQQLWMLIWSGCSKSKCLCGNLIYLTISTHILCNGFLKCGQNRECGIQILGCLLNQVSATFPLDSLECGRFKVVLFCQFSTLHLAKIAFSMLLPFHCLVHISLTAKLILGIVKYLEILWNISVKKFSTNTPF